MSQITKTSSSSSDIGWENIKETALQNKNLTADIRIGDDSSVTVVQTGWWERAKAFFGSNTPVLVSKEETVKNLKTSLREYFYISLNRLSREITTSENNPLEKLHADAESTLETLLGAFEKSNMSTSAAIQTAHGEVLEALVLLRQKYSKPELAPQFFPTSDGKISVVRPAPNIENMVLSGGGEKGVTYGAVYEVVQNAGKLTGLKHVAGSSAGSMAAACIACGMDGKALEKATAGLTVGDLFSHATDVQFQELATFNTENFGFQGSMAMQKINQELAGSIKNFLKAQTEEAFQKLPESDSAIIEELKGGLAKSSPPLITFQHLSILRKMDPSQFKELTITGFDATTKKEVYYNAAESPEMPIAQAVRISMSLPFAFEAMKSAQGNNLVDGGTASNLPEETVDLEMQKFIKNFPAFLAGKGSHAIFDNESLVKKLASSPETILPTNRTTQETMSKTVVLGFDNDGKFSSLAGGEKIYIAPSPIERAMAWLSGNPNIRSANMADNIKLWNAGPNALDVFHGTLGTASFLASSEQKDAAKLQAKTRMWEQMALRQNQATYEVVDNLESAMLTMSEGELKQIIAHYQEDAANEGIWKDSGEEDANVPSANIIPAAKIIAAAEIIAAAGVALEKFS